MMEGAGEAGEEAGGVAAGKFVLPYAQDTPAEGAAGAGDEAVAGAVGGEFLAPEGGVGFGLRGVERAAVDEDGEFEARKGEVGFAEPRQVLSLL